MTCTNHPDRRVGSISDAWIVPLKYSRIAVGELLICLGITGKDGSPQNGVIPHPPPNLRVLPHLLRGGLLVTKNSTQIFLHAL